MSVLANLETRGAPAGAEIFFARQPPKQNFWMNPCIYIVRSCNHYALVIIAQKISPPKNAYEIK